MRRIANLERTSGRTSDVSQTGAFNGIVNGAMDVSQRGPGFNLAANVAVYTLDRWQAVRAAAGSTIEQIGSDGQFVNALQIQRDSGNTSTVPIYVCQSIESEVSARFRGNNVTLSFTATAGANYSPSNDGLGVRLSVSYGVDQNHLTGTPTGRYFAIDTTVPLGAGTQRYSVSAVMPADMSQLGVIFHMDPTGTAGAADLVQITGVMLEVGDPSPFMFEHPSIAAVRCRRYFRRYGDDVIQSTWGAGYARTTNLTSKVVVELGTPMRAQPTIVLAGAHQVVASNDVQATVSAVVLQTAQTTVDRLVCNLTHASVTTAGIPVIWRAADATGLLDVSAEL